MEYNDPPPAVSRRASADEAPNTDPQCPFWQEAPGLFMSRDSFGREVPDHRTEVRSRWSSTHIFFLFICPYRDLHLRPNPTVTERTPGLWNWDVAEVFIGTLHDPLHLYKEFEVSPQGEWIDLSIDLTMPEKIADDAWRSGLQAAARIEPAQRTWYGSMRIPFAAFSAGSPSSRDIFRLNFFRSQGPTPVEIAWRAPRQQSFHAPERFGLLTLVE